VSATATTNPNFSFVLEYPAAEPAAAERHFLSKLAVETDPADVHLDLERRHAGIVLVDTRSPDAYARCHIPGAINLPARTITAETAAALPRDKVIVAYCWGPGCNGSTKAAAKLAALGFRVKEMIGGIGYWRKEGLPVQGGCCEAAAATPCSTRRIRRASARRNTCPIQHAVASGSPPLDRPRPRPEFATLPASGAPLPWRDPSNTVRGRGPACASMSIAPCGAAPGTASSG
jgi:rhodanese-related sulfurtransferase